MAVNTSRLQPVPWTLNCRIEALVDFYMIFKKMSQQYGRHTF